MKHQIMTVILDAFLIINALPPKFLQNASPYFFHVAFAPSFIWSRRPCLRLFVCASDVVFETKVLVSRRLEDKKIKS